MNEQQLVPKQETSPEQEASKSEIISGAEKEVAERFATGGNDKFGRLFLAAFSSVPWILPMSMIATLKGESDQEGLNKAFQLWLQEYKAKLAELMDTVNEISTRLDGFGAAIHERIQSPEYLSLVRRGFKAWDSAETIEKRQMIKKLLINAGTITLCPDDQVRLFIDWIERYHEAHFRVMKEVYQHQPITKGEMWDNLHPGEQRPRDDSAKVKLLSYLARELNLAGIIEVDRDVNSQGQRMRAPRRPSRPQSQVIASPIDDDKEWVLSELGREFVRYVMDEADPQLSSG